MSIIELRTVKVYWSCSAVSFKDMSFCCPFLEATLITHHSGDCPWRYFWSSINLWVSVTEVGWQRFHEYCNKLVESSIEWQGRVVEIYGPEASGKTTLALHVIAEAQKLGKGDFLLTISLWSTIFPSLDLASCALGCCLSSRSQISVVQSILQTPIWIWIFLLLALDLFITVLCVAGRCLFVDAEHALDLQFAEGIGVRIKEVLFQQPDEAEQALDTVDHFVRSGVVDVIVVDSVCPGTTGPPL